MDNIDSAAIHSAAEALYKAGGMRKETMREFDESCLVEIHEFTPSQIKKLRATLAVSQPVFALYLNVAESTIAKWESGTKRTTGAAVKLLNVIQKHGLEVLR